MVKVSDPSSYGLIVTDDEMRITKFIEKPKPDQITTDTINAGVYVFQPEVLNEIPKDREVSVEKETFPSILEKGMDMYGYIHYGYWLDVGTIEKYKKANFDLIDGKFNLLYKRKEERIEKEKTSFIGENITVEGKLVVDEDVIIEGNSVFKGNIIIGKKSFIGKNCFIENSIIMKNVFIEEKSIIKNSIIGNSVFIKNNCEIVNSAIGDKSFITEFSKIVQ